MNFLKTFNEYIDSIEEMLNTPQPINWKINIDDIAGYFTVRNKKYKISVIKQIGENYSFTFAYDNEGNWYYYLSNLGIGGFAVLSTITFAMDYIYEKYNPNSIIFSAVDDSDTRKNLYKQHCEMFCKKHDCLFTNRGSSGKLIFLLYKKDLPNKEKEEIMQSVIKIAEVGKTSY